VTSPAARLRSLLDDAPPVVAPGAFNPLFAKLIEEAAFPAVYLSGAGVANSLLGRPDLGILTQTEMVAVVDHVCQAVDVPVIADGDTGYGGEHNVARLVKAYEQVGVQCIQLEDQLSPKRCGHMENKEVVSLEEATTKIAMAVQSRNSRDFLIMARTDTRATHNLSEALKRGESYLNAGADILFIEAPQSIEEMEIIKREFPDVILVANMVEEGKTPELSVEQCAALGFQIILRPISSLLAVARTLQLSYSALKHNSGQPETVPRLTFQDYNELVGLPDYQK